MHPLVVTLAILAWSLPLPLLLQFVLAIVLPIAVGLITTRVTRPNLKAVLLLLGSFVTSFVTELLEAVTASQPFDVGLWLLKALGTFATGVTLHYGLFKPTGITAAAQRSLVKAKPAQVLDVDPDEDGMTILRTPDQRGHATIRTARLGLVLVVALAALLLVVSSVTPAHAASPQVSPALSPAKVVSHDLVIVNAGSTEIKICDNWRHESSYDKNGCGTSAHPSRTKYLQPGQRSDRYFTDTDGVQLPRNWKLKEDKSGPNPTVLGCDSRGTYWRKVSPTLTRHTRHLYLKRC